MWFECRYDAGLVKPICALQLTKDLQGVTAEEMKSIVIACKSNIVTYTQLLLVTAATS